MSQQPAGYEYPVIKGLSAKVIQHFKGRANDLVAGAREELRHAVKFSLGDSNDLPSVCGLDDEVINAGPLRLPFDLMAIETTSNEDDGDYACTFLFKRISPTEVRVFTFMRKPGSSEWLVPVSWCAIEYGAVGIHHHQIISSSRIESEDQRNTVIGLAKAAKSVLQALHSLIECNNVAVAIVLAPKAGPGQKLGRRKRELLQFEYRILTIKGHKTYEGGSSESHRSPRLHLRRGHIRKLPTGKTTWVSSCAVGSGKRGTIQKDYSVEVQL